MSLTVLRELGKHKYLGHFINILEPLYSKEISFPVRSKDFCGSLSVFVLFFILFSTYSSVYQLPLYHHADTDSGVVFSSAPFYVLIFPLGTLHVWFRKGEENILLPYPFLLYWHDFLNFPSIANRAKIKGIFRSFSCNFHHLAALDSLYPRTNWLSYHS